MHQFFKLYLLFFCYCLVHCDQPYFPPQVVFTVDNGQKLYAIDEVNQQAYASIKDDSPQSGYVFRHFPYSPADTPQSKYYVQLVTGLFSNSCAYGTYWKYGGNPYNLFPAHWNNITSFQIKGFLDINYHMIKAHNGSMSEDHWYSQETCNPDIGVPGPCLQIYFQKNTDIPLRSIALATVSRRQYFQTTEYKILSIGKPDDKYFANIPKNWYTSCLDVNLRVTYFYDRPIVSYHDYKAVGVSLFTPPHRINQNDTVTIQWKVVNGCTGCLTWTPQQLIFNSQNFNQIQNLTFYRRTDSLPITLNPIFIGGGFDLVSPGLNNITFEAS